MTDSWLDRDRYTQDLVRLTASVFVMVCTTEYSILKLAFTMIRGSDDLGVIDLNFCSHGVPWVADFGPSFSLAQDNGYKLRAPAR